MTQFARLIDFVNVKRNIPMTGRSYGHWWLELDGEESYGWWPARAPLGVLGIIRGTSGTLNGLGVSASGGRTRDPNHGLLADYEFHPVSVTARTDNEIRDDIRLFASTFAGGWRWSVRPTMNCRLFQLALLDAAGLVDGTGNYHTRGDGCPALLPGRLLLGRLTGRRRWPRNMPQPGQRIAELGAHIASPLPAAVPTARSSGSVRVAADVAIAVVQASSTMRSSRPNRPLVRAEATRWRAAFNQQARRARRRRRAEEPACRVGHVFQVWSTAVEQVSAGRLGQALNAARRYCCVFGRGARRSG